MTLLIIAGFISGIVAGMGVGGGSLLIPILALFTDMTQQEIQGINLIVFVPSSVAALVVHIKKKSVEFSSAKPIIVYGLVGAAAGAFLALYLSPHLLRKIFALFIIAIGIFQLFKKGDKQS